MTPRRILSQSGNVIAADFRKRTSIDIQVKAQVLYCDELIYLARFTLLFNGEVIATEHITAAL